LPPELIFEILSCLYYKSDGRVDFPTLAACTLVHSLWTTAAQKLMFHNVPLPDDCSGSDNCKSRAFREALDPSTERGRRLGGYVRRLDIWVGPSPEWHTPAVFVTILRDCPNLYELNFTPVGMYAFEETVLAQLMELCQSTGPHVRALRPIGVGVQSPIIYQLLAVWPSVKFLHLSSELIASPPDEPPGFSLYELTLSRNVPQEITTWFLTRSEASLQILTLRELPGPDLVNTLSRHGPRIRSIRFFDYGKRTAALVRACSNLQEVVLYKLASVRDLDLPPSVEHLSFRTPFWEKTPKHALRPILEVIPTLPALWLVTGDQDIRGYEEWPLLQHMCEERGVTLASDGLSALLPEDPILPDKFPRGRSVSNFRYIN
ncbi:hypothetical protein GLOTRDRAFT_43638, partial [Gloeophyllum trabeum ATCC 11539]